MPHVRRAPGGRNRIEAGATPGMATQDTAERQPAAAERPVCPQCLDGVERAAGGEAAAVRQRRRDQVTINENEGQKKAAQEPIEAATEGGCEEADAGDRWDRPLPFANSAKAEHKSASRSA